MVVPKVLRLSPDHTLQSVIIKAFILLLDVIPVSVQVGFWLYNKVHLFDPWSQLPKLCLLVYILIHAVHRLAISQGGPGP